jgi:antitoxin MazE
MKQFFTPLPCSHAKQINHWQLKIDRTAACHYNYKRNYIQEARFMEAKLIQIGNSKGIRIPHKILSQSGIDDKIELTAKNGTIILKPLKKAPREGWALQAKKMRAEGDDRLLLPDVLGDDQELDW